MASVHGAAVSAAKKHLSLVRRETRVPDIIAALPDTLAAVESAAMERADKRHLRVALAGLTFAYWAHKFQHKRALLDPKRDRLIQARLEECGDNVSDLLWALDAAAKDPWVIGTDPKCRHPNDSLEYLFRDRGMVERFGDRMRGFREDQRHPLATKHLGDE
jgi:hypothetical protein